MLNSKKLSSRFWEEVVNTACNIINRIYLRHRTMKTPYEIWKGRIPNLRYFHVFGCVCYILKDIEHLGKFEANSDYGIFL